MFVSQQTAATGASANAIISGLLARQRALVPFQQALRVIPIEEKAEYLEALRVAPRLIDSEADPLFFLEHAELDATKAARRFVEYWRRRRAVFRERAFLPLDLSGNGAMSLEDIEYMKQGTFAVLGSDSEGCPVYIYDRARGEARSHAFVCHLRAHFYIWNEIFRKHPKGRTAGVVGLILPSQANSWLLKNQADEAVDTLASAIPLRVKAVHMLYLRQDKRHMIQQIIPWLMKYLHRLVAEHAIMHNFDSVEKLSQGLESYGIAREILPRAFGGTFDYERDYARFLIQHGLSVSVQRLNAAVAAARQSSHPFLSIQKASLAALTGGPAIAFHTTSSLLNTNGHKPSSPLLSSATQPSHRASLDSSTSTNSEDKVRPFAESAATRERGLASLNEAMRMLPDEDKAPYFEAVRRVPHLVERESNPLKYLRFEKFNAWTAATRLACYWKHRVSAFQDRAFLPLTQTPGGALEAEDIDAIKSGYFSFLAPDSSGRTVMCYDVSKRKAQSSQTRTRVTFYIFSIISENEKSLRDGYISLLLLASSSFGSAQLDGSMQANINIALDAFPIRLEKLHIIYPPQHMGGAFSFISNLLPFIMKVLARVVNPKTDFHVGVSPEELHRKLESYGIERSSLPHSLGGGVQDSDFAQWVKNREQLELRTYGQTVLAAKSSTPTDSSRSQSEEVALSSVPAGILQAGAQEMHRAMTLLPENEKSAYMEAMQREPDLVRKESDPTRFLRAVNFDNLAAARWLARYWKIRKQIFGERSLLPMDQTGDGALDRKDVSVLQNGYLTQLPCDIHGLGVICCQGSRLQKSSSQSRLRCTFYIWSCISENEKSQTAGYSVLYTITDPSFDRANKECLDLAMQALPVKLKAFHLLGCIPEDTRENDYLEGPVHSTFEVLDPSIQSRVVIHACSSRTEFVKKLATHGISEHGLPRSLGGKWGFQEFVQWQELRVRHEWSLPIGSGTRDAAGTFRIPTSRVPVGLSMEEKSERKRRMNVIHSRRKRERERIEVEGLNEQCTEMREENKRLGSEGRRLKQLLDNAEHVIKEA